MTIGSLDTLIVKAHIRMHTNSLNIHPCANGHKNRKKHPTNL